MSKNVSCIDVHGHVFPDFLAEKAVQHVHDMSEGMPPPALRGTRDALLESMHRGGIDHVVTLPVATKISQVSSINASLPEATEEITPFGAIHPESPDYRREISQLEKRGIRGVKIHPEFQNFYIDAPSLDEFFSYLAKSSLIVLTHAGHDPGPFSGEHATPERIKARLTRTPGLTLIAAHMGGFLQWDRVEEYLVGEDLYLDTAAVAGYMSQTQFERICRTHGTERILFGSDSPWFSQSRARGFVESCSFSRCEQEDIFFRSAQKLLW
ncbi:amidohydrolase family protein [Chitinivibrio alkaliphilus]|uniref:Amidohydrolase 2 n=1 Tax=Chitinivibrio alkaliphilus ACht1 TaxID=1313304 RepID=U7DCE7_9BACT|nr:amidohydrolase family protein [Chitinivibrio alkaliphilus]ERP39248.1 amidohydrolase 2 [Chitinivibrio alkaliphilus ACht1]